jgi:hypothetical protein
MPLLTAIGVRHTIGVGHTLAMSVSVPAIKAFGCLKFIPPQPILNISLLWYD